MRATLALIATLMTAPAFAGPATDAVKVFYKPDVYVADKVYRDRFVDPALQKFKENDSTAEGEIGCIDFALQYDAQDLDDAEVARTLKFTEKVNGDKAEVTSTFRLFPSADASDRSITWTLKKVGTSWKISDIASAASNWKLSEFDCKAE